MSTKEDFYQDISRFNDLYKLANHSAPTLLPVERLAEFADILGEELAEVKDLQARYQAALSKQEGAAPSAADRLLILTELSDWLGDIVVYCASEAQRWGLPLPAILGIIMQSNFSKLGADGLPIYDHRGKVLKGPNYWKPEPKILELLQGQEN